MRCHECPGADTEIIRVKADDMDKIESAAWLLLDVAEYLREPPAINPVDKRMRSTLASKIMRQLTQEERNGDLLGITATIRDLMMTERSKKKQPT